MPDSDDWVPVSWGWTEDADMPSDEELDALMAANKRPVTPRPLSVQQLQVLVCASHGLNASEISTLLGISFEGVRDSQKRIRHKLAAKTLPHAVAIAIREGLIR